MNQTFYGLFIFIFLSLPFLGKTGYEALLEEKKKDCFCCNVYK